LEDFELIRRSLDGSREAFSELVGRYQDRILNVVLHVLGDPHDAEDVAQECFSKAYRRLSSFDFRSSFYTWLYRIAVNSASDFRKKMRRRQALPLSELELPLPQQGSQGEAPERAAIRKELGARIRDLLAGLPEKFRTVLILRELEERSYEEIAAILGLSIGTVESRLFRARARLREKLRFHLNA
jgi:RNA polymerase sigma-70 factor (ECF subfamily)